MKTIKVFILIVLISSCSNYSNRRLVSTSTTIIDPLYSIQSDKARQTIIIENSTSKEIILWLSEETSPIRFFYNQKGDSLSIMDVIHEYGSTLNIKNPNMFEFDIPFINFYKVLDPGKIFSFVLKEQSNFDYYKNSIQIVTISEVFVDFEIELLNTFGYKRDTLYLE
ncbi:MAG: hypothetical protein IJL56_04035 [Bacteroidales bacterium]|nr:hypothetical protein [Bacteroidales bacterium]